MPNSVLELGNYRSLKYLLSSPWSLWLSEFTEGLSFIYSKIKLFIYSKTYDNMYQQSKSQKIIYYKEYETARLLFFLS